MNDDDASPAARVSAASAILDRGWGKPAQTVNQNIDEKRCATDWSDEELIAFLNDCRAQAEYWIRPSQSARPTLDSQNRRGFGAAVFT